MYKEQRYEALLIKLFDRLHNIQTISAKSPEKIKKIIDETLNHFIILAEYLGLPIISKIIHIYTDVNTVKDTNLNITKFCDQEYYQPLSLIYQNALHHKYSLSLQVPCNRQKITQL